MSDEERIQDPGEVSGEDDLDRSLRPKSLDAFVGQPSVKEKLGIFLEAAKQRGEALDHVLLAGPPGLGKTSLAAILATEMNVAFHPTSGPVLEKKGDLAAVLTQLGEGDILFIDEIHRLSRVIEETLYPAMEDFQLDVMLGQGPSARTLRLDLPRFTLVGATTRTGLLASPLRDRFGVVERLDYYAAAELAEIITRSAGMLDVAIDPDGADMLAGRSRGTPRIANRLLRRVRDVVQVRGHAGIDAVIAEQALTLLEVDGRGLDELDRKILRFLCEVYEGRPVGLGTLADAVGEAADTIEDVYEPYLLQEGLIQRTPRGRQGTPRAFQHLGMPLPSRAGQDGLF